MKQHLGDGRTEKTNAIGEHFSSPGHSIADMTFSVIEKLNRNDVRYRKTKESYHIQGWNLKYRGLNRKK